MMSTIFALQPLDFLARDHASEQSCADDAMQDDAALILLDAEGHIEFCSDSIPWLQQDDSLLGKHISQVFPHMPLRHHTPGYNLAYVHFAFASNRWQRHMAHLAEQTLQPLDIVLRHVRLHGRDCLVGLLRPVRRLLARNHPIQGETELPAWGRNQAMPELHARHMMPLFATA